MQSSKMKKDESFLGKLGGSLARKKKSKEGESAGAEPCFHSVGAAFLWVKGHHSLWMVSVHGSATDMLYGTENVLFLFNDLFTIKFNKCIKFVDIIVALWFRQQQNLQASKTYK